MCGEFAIKPVEACVQFAINIPGINSVALNTTSAKRVKENIGMVRIKIPKKFWETLAAHGLINVDYISKDQYIF